MQTLAAAARGREGKRRIKGSMFRILSQVGNPKHGKFLLCPRGMIFFLSLPLDIHCCRFYSLDRVLYIYFKGH